jgi:hypothetical protein
VLALVLRALAWNVHFGGVAEDSAFLSSFFSVFSATFCRGADLLSVPKADTPVYANLLVCFDMILTVRTPRFHASETFGQTAVHFDALVSLAGSHADAALHVYALRTLEA